MSRFSVQPPSLRNMSKDGKKNQLLTLRRLGTQRDLVQLQEFDLLRVETEEAEVVHRIPDKNRTRTTESSPSPLHPAVGFQRIRSVNAPVDGDEIHLLLIEEDGVGHHGPGRDHVAVREDDPALHVHDEARGHAEAGAVAVEGAHTQQTNAHDGADALLEALQPALGLARGRRVHAEAVELEGRVRCRGVAGMEHRLVGRLVLHGDWLAEGLEGWRASERVSE
ncbi:unnamed protein product [Phytophthora fragariaefolia]|uniref:Unnamed protein product n=1 Tax=Phytophthora fragariaefolia TaxID=1490495 RepID=A0A9W6YJ48_9STRA|nr:unnamed protein product [Phytophthora fragariaefolia]